MCRVGLMAEYCLLQLQSCTVLYELIIKRLVTSLCGAEQHCKLQVLKLYSIEEKARWKENLAGQRSTVRNVR